MQIITISHISESCTETVFTLQEIASIFINNMKIYSYIFVSIDHKVLKRISMANFFF